MTQPFADYMTIATEVALQSGAVLKEFWGKIQEIHEKDYPGDLVTNADCKSEEVAIDLLQKHFPKHGILGEETGLSRQESEYLWMIDPLDGTTNYAHQYPMFAVSIGLIYQGKAVLGVVYNPIQNEMFQAYQGAGATLNGQPIRVSKTSDLSQSLLATGFAYDRRETQDNNYAEFCYFTHLTQGVRRAGAASLDLAYVAAGRLDGYWERGLKPWDMAAGMVLVQEAGGQIAEYDLSPINLYSGRILATNGLLHSALSEELMQVRADVLRSRA
jgi:myo-inositol-1(or 4)-monophosphatase